MKLLGSLWKRFKYLDYEEKLIEKCRKKMDEDNIHALRWVSCLLIIILCILVGFYVTFDNNPIRNIICIGAGILMLAIYFTSGYLLRHVNLITSVKTDILIYIFSGICFLAAIYLGTFAAGDEMAVPSVWMFFFVILIFNRMPLQNLSAVIVASVVFFVCSYMTKRSYIFAYDVMHTITSIIAAVFMAWEKSRMKAENVLALMRLNEANLEIQGTVEEQERQVVVLRQKAARDALTGLYNKEVFQEKTEELIERSGNGATHALVCVDVDDFKNINDTYGHLFGDGVLKKIASVLQQACGEENLVGRFGGDEFLVFFPNITDKQVVRRVAESIIAQGEAPYKLEGIQLYVKLSAGVAFYPESGRNYHSLFVHADKELYHAKSDGKGKFAMKE